MSIILQKKKRNSEMTEMMESANMDFKLEGKYEIMKRQMETIKKNHREFLELKMTTSEMKGFSKK